MLNVGTAAITNKMLTGFFIANPPYQMELYNLKKHKNLHWGLFPQGGFKLESSLKPLALE